MKKLLSSLRIFPKYFPLASLAVAPVAVLVSCSTSSGDTKVATYRDKIVDNLRKVTYFGPDAISTSASPQVIALDPIAKQYKYLSGNYSTLTAAKAAPASEWKDALPSDVSFQKKTRNLWLRVIPKTLAEISGDTGIKQTDLDSLANDNQYFDLSYVSKIKFIKSDIAATAQYKALVLESIVLSGTFDNPLVSANNIVLPEGTKLEFKIGDDTIQFEDLPTYIKNNKDKISSEVLASSKIRLGVLDPNEYFLAASKDAPLTSLLAAADSFENLLNALQHVVASLNSDNTSVSWLGLRNVQFSKPSTVERIEYYAGAETSAEAVNQNSATTWSPSLPATVSADHQARNLWVKLTPVSGKSLPSTLVNITDSSQIRKVKTLVTQIPSLIDKVSLSGTLEDLAINNPLTSLGSYLKLEFKIKDVWREQDEFVNYVKQNAFQLTPQDFSSVRARVVFANDDLYKVGSSYEADVTNTIKFTYAPSATFISALSNLKPFAASTSASVAWDKVEELASALPREISSISYYAGPLSQVSEVSTSPSAAWSASLPTSVSDSHRERHLFAKLTPIAPYTIASPIIDLTDFSSIQKIKSLIRPSVTDLSVISILGTVESLVVTNPVAAPDNTKFQLQIKGSWVDITDAASYVRRNASSITASDLVAIKARYAVKDESLYALPRSYETLISSSVKFLYTPTELLKSAMRSIKALASSNHRAVRWDKLADLLANRPSEISQFSFFAGAAATVEDLASTPNVAWSATLPTIVSSVHSERHLYVKLTPASSYVIGEPIIDLTGSSDIQKIKTQITPATTTDLSSINWSGTLVSLTINNLVPAPDNLKVQFKIKGSWIDSSEISSYARSNANIITTTDLQSIRVRYAARETSLFTLTNDYETSISTNVRLVYTPDTFFMAKLYDITPRTSSIDSNVKWENVPAVTAALPQEIIEVRYYYGSIEQVASVAADDNIIWSTTLPTTISSAHRNRHLYAKLVPISTYEIASPIIDLTSTSSIQSIPTRITTPELAFSTISYAFNNGVATLDAKGIVAPDNTVMQYQFNGDGIWRTAEGLISYLNQLDATVPATAYQNVSVRLAPESDLFIVSSGREAIIRFSTSSYRESLVSRLLEEKYFASESISTNVVVVAPNIDKAVLSYEYLSGYYGSLDAVKAAPSSSWSTSLPKTVTYNKVTRYLWMRINVKTPAQLGALRTVKSFDLDSFKDDNKYLNLTNESRIRFIQTDIAQQVGFDSLDISGATIEGTLDAPVVKLNNLTPPLGAKFVFVINGTVQNSSTDLVNYIKNNKRTLSREALATIKIRIALSDQENYALSKTRDAAMESLKILPILKNVQEWQQAYPQFSAGSKFDGDKVVRAAFWGARLPSGFALPSSVTEIGQDAFKSVKLPLGFSIPSSVRTIGINAFESAEFAKDFKLPATTQSISFGVNVFRWATFPAQFTSLPSTIETIPDNLFNSVVLPAGFNLSQGVRKIGAYAFAGTNLPSSFRIPSTVTEIANQAFYNAILPNDFVVPSTVITVAFGAFLNATYQNGNKYQDGTPWQSWF